MPTFSPYLRLRSVVADGLHFVQTLLNHVSGVVFRMASATSELIRCLVHRARFVRSRSRAAYVGGSALCSNESQEQGNRGPFTNQHTRLLQDEKIILLSIKVPGTSRARRQSHDSRSEAFVDHQISPEFSHTPTSAIKAGPAKNHWVYPGSFAIILAVPLFCRQLDSMDHCSFNCAASRLYLPKISPID
jgi:hypothetical protein